MPKSNNNGTAGSGIVAVGENVRPHPQPNSRCFVCGSENAAGLHLHFELSDNGCVATEWRTAPIWESFRGIIHGGLISTVLDEAMSKAVSLSGRAGLTCELRVRLRHHIVPGECVRVKGWVVDRRKRRILAEAELLDQGGVERAHAWATFLEVI